MKSLSNAQQIKELYKEFLSDGKEHSRIDLFQYAREHSGIHFTDGMLTGALRTLVTDTDDYICIRRGCYKKKTPDEHMHETSSIVAAYIEILNDTLKKSKSITSDPFQVIKMSSDDLEKMKDIEKCIDIISKTVEKIQYNNTTN